MYDFPDLPAEPHHSIKLRKLIISSNGNWEYFMKCEGVSYNILFILYKYDLVWWGSDGIPIDL